LSLFVGFNFGLASVQWEFKLTPLLMEATPASFSPAIGTNDDNNNNNNNNLDDDEELLSIFPKSTSRTGAGTVTSSKQLEKRTKRFLEDSDLEDATNNDMMDDEDEGEEEDDEEEGDEDDAEGDYDYLDRYDREGRDSIGTRAESRSMRRKKKKRVVQGMAVMFDQLVLPLVSVSNAYRRQIKALEMVIKSKENEVVEALEMLEQNGINYHNRRKATERYDKQKTETKLKE
ncbi:hypothetical protein BX616_008902, partial [Lobosporangium transversale]